MTLIIAGWNKLTNQIGDFFFAGMEDSTALDKNGISDLKNHFDMIDAIKDINGIIKTAAADLMRLETAIANSSRKREDTRDPWAN
jgi:predicted metalloendopeptidase